MLFMLFMQLARYAVYVPYPMSHFLVRPRRAAATRTNAAIDASRRGANVNF